MSAASTETSAPLPAATSRVFFQPPAGVGCAGTGPMPRDDPVQRKQGKVTVKYDRKELRKRLILEEWIIEQLSDLYDCEASLALSLVDCIDRDIGMRSHALRDDPAVCGLCVELSVGSVWSSDPAVCGLCVELSVGSVWSCLWSVCVK
ncbi:unnamed protein product [Coregonus sp. 'balchen']|nr:unnamed protein product [Coregonus sp. 'balchen']